MFACMFTGHFFQNSRHSFSSYCTGTTRSPFPKSIRIDFNESDAIAVHTCDQLLVLPVGLLRRIMKDLKMSLTQLL